jgi:hypothetical protein
MATKARVRAKKRPGGKRDTIKAGKRGPTMYAKRNGTGQFTEMDAKGRSLKADRRVKAKTETTSGFGDQGDQRRPSDS